MKIIIDIETDNASFKDNFDYQLKLILDKVIKSILVDDLTGNKIRDINGNTVGSFNIIYDD